MLASIDDISLGIGVIPHPLEVVIVSCGGSEYPDGQWILNLVPF
jgi:hypothetical protein